MSGARLLTIGAAVQDVRFAVTRVNLKDYPNTLLREKGHSKNSSRFLLRSGIQSKTKDNHLLRWLSFQTRELGGYVLTVGMNGVLLLLVEVTVEAVPNVVLGAENRVNQYSFA